MEGYVPRLVDRLLEEYIKEIPAVMGVGPRACGKTTTALRLVRSVVRLDSDQAASFRAGPDAALHGREEPVLLDEWQMVPEVLGAVKRAIDTDRRPGRYLITGSARTDPTDRLWPLTGRAVMLRMHPLTVAEQEHRPVRPLIDRIAEGEEPVKVEGPPVDLRVYLQIALKGGFPEPALKLSEWAARAWLESYADQIALRDSRTLGSEPDAYRLKRYLEAYAINSGRIVQHKTIYDAAGISRKTALAYDALLSDLMVLNELPAWATNRLKRLSRAPRRYLVDSGLLGGILRVGIDDVMANGDLLGTMIETFVIAQLQAQAAVSSTRYRLSHLRERDGRREVDVIAELSGGRVIAIEIKAGSKIRSSDARHLSWLGETMQERFVGGVVLHTGPDTYRLGDRIFATPISTLWA
ncbi:MAG: ATP-binding protein [Acidimicrobiia bacterium]|nr:ATP-binding protein [Acidimicrobiia bacterium]